MRLFIAFEVLCGCALVLTIPFLYYFLPGDPRQKDIRAQELTNDITITCFSILVSLILVISLTLILWLRYRQYLYFLDHRIKLLSQFFGMLVFALMNLYYRITL